MKRINTIIIDDEISAVNTLSGMLNEYCPEINITATASNEKEAIVALSRYDTDLVMLDIEMPPYSNGLDILAKFPERNFETIVTTAYPHYAINSVNLIQPCGYLVKPFSVDQLILCIKKASNIIRNAVITKENKFEQGLIVADLRKGNVVLRFNEVLYVKYEDLNCSIFYVSNGKENKINCVKTLREIEVTLPDYFIKISQNIIVNMDKVSRYSIVGRGGEVLMTTDTALEISVAKFKAFQERFSEFVAVGK